VNTESLLCTREGEVYAEYTGMNRVHSVRRMAGCVREYIVNASTQVNADV